MYEFVKQRLKDLGKTQKELAQKMKIEAPHLSAIFKGIRKIKVDEIIPMAQFLDLDVTYFMEYLSGLVTEEELLNHQRKRIPMAGYVQAGEFREACPIPGDDWLHYSFPVEDKFFKCNLFALEVVGESMNKVFDPGDKLICCPLSEWIYATGQKDVEGHYVIVYCYESHGLCEATVKMYNRVDKDTVILTPMSTNPDFKPIVLHPDNNNEYQIAAVVIGYIHMMNNQKRENDE